MVVCLKMPHCMWSICLWSIKAKYGHDNWIEREDRSEEICAWPLPTTINFSLCICLYLCSLCSLKSSISRSKHGKRINTHTHARTHPTRSWATHAQFYDIWIHKMCTRVCFCPNHFLFHHNQVSVFGISIWWKNVRKSSNRTKREREAKTRQENNIPNGEP